MTSIVRPSLGVLWPFGGPLAVAPQALLPRGCAAARHDRRRKAGDAAGEASPAGRYGEIWGDMGRCEAGPAKGWITPCTDGGRGVQLRDKYPLPSPRAGDIRRWRFRHAAPLHTATHTGTRARSRSRTELLETEPTLGVGDPTTWCEPPPLHTHTPTLLSSRVRLRTTSPYWDVRTLPLGKRNTRREDIQDPLPSHCCE